MRWFESGIGYQIYPQSFLDTNGDGIGDMRGIIQKLDYFCELGVTFLWIGPIYQSPQDDGGYDISDFYHVDPRYGSDQDLKELLAKAHQKGLRILLDLVMNHSSDQHPWFLESRESADNPKRDYYIWRKGKNGGPPNNWESFFSESAWQYDKLTDMYYMKIFSAHMPDLNWANPEVRQEMFALAKYWLDLGVDGFRLDAISHLSRDESFRDSRKKADATGFVPDWSKFSNRPKVFEYLKDFRHQVLDNRDVLAVGEVGGGASVGLARKFSDPLDGGFDLVFTFDHCWQNDSFGNDTKEDQKFEVQVDKLKAVFDRWYRGMHQDRMLVVYWLNHDHPRVLSQYGDTGVYRKESAKMLANTLYFLYGTPFIYQGEEIGMSNVTYQKISDFRDVSAQNYYKSAKDRLSKAQILKFLRRTSRINARTPMQWDDGEHAGFTTGSPWVKVNDNYLKVNVKDQMADPDSIWHHYQKVLTLRKEPKIRKAIIHGKLKWLHLRHPDIFAYSKITDELTLTVISNFRNREIEFPLGEYREIHCHNYPDLLIRNHKIVLRPYESVVVFA